MAVSSDAVVANVLSADDAPIVLSAKRRAAIMDVAGDLLYGSFAGVIGKYIEYPFDTVKVRLQSQPDHLPLRYAGPVDCFRQSIRADGFLGLYRGISAPLVGAALETSSLFSFERLGRASLVWTGVFQRDEPLPLSALFFTGAFSGAFTSFLLTPIELVKCKIQVTVPAAPGVGDSVHQATTRTEIRGPLGVIREIYRHEGLRGFWHGQLGTLIREAGGCAAWFGGKETTTKLMREWNVQRALADGAEPASEAALEHLRTGPLPLWQQAVAGASAGMSYNFLFFPADTVKSRMQTAPVGLGTGSSAVNCTPRRTFMDESRALWKQAGLRGFYRGCGVTVARSAPSSAFIFMVYDGLKTYLPLA